MQNTLPAKSSGQYGKILVVCPAGMVSGGPEALHHLVYLMRNLGLPAYITYLPFNKTAVTPDAYKKYAAPVADYADDAGNFILFPEIYPYLALKVRQAKAGIWWLSLDNFLERRHISPLHDKIRYLKGVIKGRRPLRGAKALGNLLHFYQSEYAARYLRSCNLEPIPLLESINEDFLTDKFLHAAVERQNIILYNPIKGKEITAGLRAANPQWQFQALQGLNPEQLSGKLCSAKLYIDFGHHPGRDRLPREAAIHGCCVITGRLGAAGNDSDLPIPANYKLDSFAPDFTSQFQILVEDVFSNFAKHFSAFAAYREYLKSEPAIFRRHVADFFIPPNA